MNARLLALAAGLPFALGVAVGAGAGPVAVATAADQPEAVAPMSGMPMEGMPMEGMGGMSTEAMAAMHADREAMDAMHASMADQMPAELREACDAMHAGMADGEMPMGDMPMRGDMPAGMPGDHADHHR
jgi:hypothetical protein